MPSPSTPDAAADPAPDGNHPPAARGTVFVIGGAEDKAGRRELLQRFVRLAGTRPRIAVVPTASTLGHEVVDLYEALFRRLGAGDVVALRPETRAEAQDQVLAKELDDVDAVFMTGGNQLKLAAVCVGTRFGRAVIDVHARGGVVGGTSAGASIVSEHMVAFGTGGPTPRHRMSQLARGLGLLADVVVDQHFRERDRYGRLISLIAQSPSLLGVGIDEDTAAIVVGSMLQVAGRGAVTVVDAENAVTTAPNAKASRPLLVSGALVHTLPAGARFDLDSRTLVDFDDPVPPEEAADIAATETGMRRLARRIAREDAAPPVRRRPAAD
jgi:cyanophycinase